MRFNRKPGAPGKPPLEVGWEGYQYYVFSMAAAAAKFTLTEPEAVDNLKNLYGNDEDMERFAAAAPAIAAMVCDNYSSPSGSIVALSKESLMRQSLPVAFTLVALSVSATALAAPIDNAALDEASKVFMAQRQKCGDKIVAAIDVTPPQGGFAPSLDPKAGKPHTIYNEAVGVERRPSGQGSKLNEADRLNGLQWKGRVQMVAKAAREISVPRGGGGAAGAWTQWQPNVILATIDVEQRNGVWETKMQSGNAAALGRYAQMRRPSCAEVPS